MRFDPDISLYKKGKSVTISLSGEGAKNCSVGGSALTDYGKVKGLRSLTVMSNVWKSRIMQWHLLKILLGVSPHAYIV